MAHDKDFALVPRPPSALEKAVPGAQRLLSGMVADTLALVSKDPHRLAKARRRLGQYEWCEPDYHQILIWASATGLKPEEVIGRLLDPNSLREDENGQGRLLPVFDEPLLADGRILKLNWDLRLLPCSKLEWVDGLEITHLRFLRASADKVLEDLGELPLPKLAWLRCRGLGLIRIDLTSLPALRCLDCAGNQLGRLAVTNLPELARLQCRRNDLFELTFEGATKLAWLDCSGNKLTDLDLSRLECLEFASCAANDLSRLNLVGTPNLDSLDCSGNQLEELSLAGAPDLGTLDCSGNFVHDLDLRKCEALASLDCSRNLLSALDLSSAHGLQFLDCRENSISELDLSGCPNLVELHCSGNRLATLDIRELAHLESVTYDEAKTQLLRRPYQDSMA